MRKFITFIIVAMFLALTVPAMAKNKPCDTQTNGSEAIASVTNVGINSNSNRNANRNQNLNANRNSNRNSNKNTNANLNVNQNKNSNKNVNKNSNKNTNNNTNKQNQNQGQDQNQGQLQGQGQSQDANNSQGQLQSANNEGINIEGDTSEYEDNSVYVTPPSTTPMNGTTSAQVTTPFGGVGYSKDAMYTIYKYKMDVTEEAFERGYIDEAERTKMGKYLYKKFIRANKKGVISTIIDPIF